MSNQVAISNVIFKCELTQKYRFPQDRIDHHSILFSIHLSIHRSVLQNTFTGNWSFPIIQNILIVSIKPKYSMVHGRRVLIDGRIFSKNLYTGVSVATEINHLVKNNNSFLSWIGILRGVLAIVLKGAGFDSRQQRRVFRPLFP